MIGECPNVRMLGYARGDDGRAVRAPGSVDALVSTWPQPLWGEGEVGGAAASFK